MKKHILYLSNALAGVFQLQVLLLSIACCLLSLRVQAQSIYTQAGATLYVTGAAAVDGAASALPTLYLEGAIQNTGTLQNQGEIQMQGDFSNTGTFTTSGDEVFKGSAIQNVSGNFTTTNHFSNMVVDKTTNPLGLSTDADVNTTVNLVNGKVLLNTSHLTIAPAGTMTSYDANDYIMTNSTGSLKQTVTGSNVVFPVGNSSYNPTTLNNAGTSDVFSARVEDAVGCTGNTLGITNKVNRTWHLDEATLGGSNASITNQWNTADEDVTFLNNQSAIAIYDGTNFLLPATNSAAISVAPSVWSQTQTGQTMISPRIVTSMDGVTIVGNTSFCDGGSVTLQSPTNGAYTYQWNKNGIAIAGATASSYIADESGDFNVSIMVNGTCVMKTAPITVVEFPVPPAPTITFTNPATANSSITVCAGTMVTMTSPTLNVVDYLWYKNGLAANYIQGNPNYTVGTLTAGTDVYTLAVSYGGGQCLSAPSNALTIVKQSPPATITVTGPTTFCANTPSTLNANAGMATYVWKRSNVTVQSGASASYVPTASGNHNVTVTDSNGCSKTSTWTNLIVNPTPIANAGVDKSVCEGTTVQIGSNNNPSYTYTWTPNTGLSNAFISNPMASAVGNINYTLTVKSAANCSNSDMVLVTALAAPTTPSLSSTTTPVCQGTSISITPTAVGASSINWYKNGVLQYNQLPNYVQTVSIPTVSGDIYTIKSKGANTCLSTTSNSINAWIKEAAVPTFTSVPAAVGNTITVCVPGGTSGTANLTASSTQASPSYSWKLTGNLIAGANNANYTVTVTTTQNNKVMSVQATYPNGCVKTSNPKTVKLVTSGCTPKMGSDKEGDMVISLEEIQINTYPNPTNGRVNIEIANANSDEGQMVLYNTLGQIILEKTIIFTNGQANEILDLDNYAIGMYSLSFQIGEKQIVQKIVKE